MIEDLRNLALVFSAADWAAVALLLAALSGTTWFIEHPPRNLPSTHILMRRYRREWMNEMAARDVRIFDAQVLATLRQGTAFFASTTLIAIGGGAAALGRIDRVDMLARDIAGVLAAPVVVWEGKILFALALLTFAFLKFVWAMRLFGYCAVLMAAVPNDGTTPRARAIAAKSAQVNVLADRSFTRGLRGLYFALSALAWFFGPAAMAGATLLTVAIIWRREFRSETRLSLLSDP